MGAGHGLQRRVKYPGGSVAEFARIRGLGRERSPRILANSATTRANHVLHPDEMRWYPPMSWVILRKSSVASK